MAVNDLLTEAEINALLYGIDSNASDNNLDEKSNNEQDPIKYAKNAKFIQKYIPEIDIICERYIVCLQAFLGKHLHQNVEITINNVLIETYIDYINSLSVPSSLNLLSNETSDLKLFLHLDTNLNYLIIEYYFGGNGKYLPKLNKQDFTKLESHILKNVAENTVSQLEKSWELIQPMKFVLQDTMYDFQGNKIIQDNEVVGIIRFKTRLGSNVGHFDLAIPHSTMRIFKQLFDN
jgi:flagellar motor switch protein FliM